MFQAPGDFFKSFITDEPADLKSEQALYYKKVIPKFPGEALFIYSFKDNRMLYADGWEDVLGYNDDEIGLLTILKLTTPEYRLFADALNDAVFAHIQSVSENLEQYSFSMELKKFHKNGTAVPLIARVGVHKAIDGRVIETIGRFQINYSIHLGKVMRYSAYGPGKDEFEEELNKTLFQYHAISKKEKEALSLVAKGYSFKEIASELGITHSAVDKRIIPLYRRFNVKSISHLISFAYENHILP